MNIEEIDVEGCLQLNKLTPRIFAQIEVLWPKVGKSRTMNWSNMYPILKQKYFNKFVVSGYVNISQGLGALSDICPGYWLILKNECQLWKVKIGKDCDEFEKNLKTSPELDGIIQIFI